MLFEIILFVFILYFFYHTNKIFKKRQKLKHINGPQPTGIIDFYLGNLRNIKDELNNDKEFPDYILQCFQKYGSIFKLQIFNRHIVYIEDLEIIKYALVTKNFRKVSSFCNSIAYPFGKRFLGHGLITNSNNELAKIDRCLFANYFQKQVITNHIEMLNEKADLFISHLAELADGKTYFEFKKEINKCTIDIIAKFAFGMEINSLYKFDEFAQHFKCVIEGILEQHRDPLIKFNPCKWAYIKNFKKSIDFLRNTGKEQIIKRIDEMEKSETIFTDLLSIIIKNKDENIENMIDDFLTFFLTGEETTSIAISFCIMELGRNKNELKKLESEIQALKNKKYLSYDDLIDLNYTGCIINETLRLWPPVPTITRQATENILINDIIIPKDTEIVFSSFSMGRNKKFWDNPLEFRPERFLDSKIIHENSCLTFSLGPRGCLGSNFFKIEAKLIIAKLIQNLDFEIDPNQSFKYKFNGNIVPRSGVRCCFKKK